MFFYGKRKSFDVKVCHLATNPRVHSSVATCVFVPISSCEQPPLPEKKWWKSWYSDRCHGRYDPRLQGMNSKKPRRFPFWWKGQELNGCLSPMTVVSHSGIWSVVGFTCIRGSMRSSRKTSMALSPSARDVVPKLFGWKKVMAAVWLNWGGITIPIFVELDCWDAEKVEAAGCSRKGGTQSWV